MKKIIIKPLLLILCSLQFSFSGITQKIDLGSWNILHVKYSLDSKWTIFGEAQIRSLKFYNNFHYYEYKGGITYKAHKNLAISLGTGHYQTYKEGGNFVLPKNNNEFRIWPQLILTQAINKWSIEQRYRTEFRFTSNGYRNRFRYRAGLTYPIGKEKNKVHPLHITVSNEIFFTDKEPYFERNRMLLACLYNLNMFTIVQVGYLHQFDYKINDETGRDFLQIGIHVALKRK